MNEKINEYMIELMSKWKDVIMDGFVDGWINCMSK